jgi:glutamine amidotransferase
MGNIGSIENMLRKIGAGYLTSDDPQVIASAGKLILPGVGAFDRAVRRIRELGLWDVLDHMALQDCIPILGVCLGMQVLGRGSEEGNLEGFGWVDAEVVRFRMENAKRQLTVPHMGWNAIQMVRDLPLFDYLPKDPRFYFVHSYHLVCGSDQDVAAWSTYGYDFCSVVNRANILGVQFHPEKSHQYGMALYRGFVEGYASAGDLDVTIGDSSVLSARITPPQPTGK